MSQPKINNFQLAGPIAATSNAIYVDKNGTGGAFTSIKAAVDSITTNSSTTPITVYVNPGIYVENTITLKPYVKLMGVAGEVQTTIVPLVNTDHIVVGANNSMIQGFTLTGASGAGAHGLHFESTFTGPTGTFRINRVRLLGNTNDLHIKGSTFTTYVLAEDLYFATISNATTTHIQLENIIGGAEMQTLFRSIAMTNIGGLGTALSEAIMVTGSNNNVYFNSLSIQAIGGVNATGDGIVVQDGGVLQVISGSVIGYNKNIVARNVGSAPTLNVAVNLSKSSTTRDLSIEHPGTLGLFSGAADISKVFIDPASTLSASYADLRSTGGTAIAGILYLGPTHAALTDITHLVNESLPTGILSGGDLSQAVGVLDIHVIGGYGYLIDSGYMKYVTWTTQDITLPDNTNNYIYVTNTGTVTSAASEPDVTTAILLGRARTSGGIITFISEIQRNAFHIATHTDTFLRSALGPIFVSGSIATENATALHLDVTAGDYFYSHLRFLPAGGTNIGFHQYYVTSGTWTKTATTNAVSNTQYNNTTTGLVSLTASYYTKHTLYVGGDGVNEQYGVVYGQAEYSTLLAAEQAALSSTPPYFTDIITPIAAIIVQQGNANIVEFIDIRPRIGFQAPSVTASAVHGDLIGLAADDHTQYLLANGTRAMSGDLNLNLNNIINVTQINGVDVDAHASRHLPNGADPLTTAAPTTSLSLVTTNSVGIANSLARSDHTHALTGVQAQSTILDNVSALATTGFISRTGAGTVAARTLTAPAAGLTITNPAGVAGDPTFALANDLGAIEALNTNGILVRTTTDTWISRTITGTSNQITVTNGDGIAGNPVLSITTDPIIPGTGSITIPTGTTAQRPGAPTIGMTRFNSTTLTTEMYDGVSWSRIGMEKQIRSGALAQTSGTTTITWGNTAPLITDGTELWTNTITPVSTTNKVSINFSITADVNTNNRGVVVAIFRGSTLIGVYPVWFQTTTTPTNISVSLLDSPATTSATTYSARIGISSAGTWYVNQAVNATFGGGLTTAYFVRELAGVA